MANSKEITQQICDLHKTQKEELKKTRRTERRSSQGRAVR